MESDDPYDPSKLTPDEQAILDRRRRRVPESGRRRNRGVGEGRKGKRKAPPGKASGKDVERPPDCLSALELAILLKLGVPTIEKWVRVDGLRPVPGYITKYFTKAEVEDFFRRMDVS